MKRQGAVTTVAAVADQFVHQNDDATKKSKTGSSFRSSFQSSNDPTFFDSLFGTSGLLGGLGSDFMTQVADSSFLGSPGPSSLADQQGTIDFNLFEGEEVIGGTQNGTPFRDSGSPQSECEHSYMYEPGTKNCTKCDLVAPCTHNTITWELGHRTCADCGLVSFGMKLKRGLPERVVYHRNIKITGSQQTAPLIIVGSDPRDATEWSRTVRDFTVEVRLLDEKTKEQISDKCLTGPKKYSFGFDHFKQDGGKEILFKGLKIRCSSNQEKETTKGTSIKNNDFIMEWLFSANKHDGNSILLASVQSQPFSVFSHSTQIDKLKKPQCPPIISLVIPSRGDLTFAGKYAILGDNIFEETLIKLGESDTINVTAHNAGAGYFELSTDMLMKIREQFNNSDPELHLPISICNDKKIWVKTQVSLTFVNDAMITQQLLFGNEGQGMNQSMDLSQFSFGSI